ncbi:transposase [Arcicella aurantiaca]|uniref:Transposase n=1 Tax=Arcicella aurantiaca TaxID=591202 RepID=A0A316DGR0_9BACT|nr:transposase [Arcicella aurantiaca]PWK17075.1 transposase [Arcicella aurantiaca]
MPRNTLNSYWERTTFLPKVNHKKSNILDYEDYLIKRWNEGEQSVKNLYKEIQEKGFKYKIRAVYELMKGYPKTIVETMLEIVKVKYYSSKQLSIWLGSFRKDWTDEVPKAYLTRLIDANPVIRKVRNAVLNFRRFMKDKTGEKLMTWCKNILNDEEEHIKGFAKGILSDYKAVFHGFESKWSNGPVEGQVNRLKTIKRQMYGRAIFQLLRKRVVITSKW